MRYNISKPSLPKMPKLGKGTECIKLLLSQASKDKREPLVPMFFPTFVIYLVLRKNSTFNSFGRSFVATICDNWPLLPPLSATSLAIWPLNTF